MPRSVTSSPDVDITLTFDLPLDPATVGPDSIRTFGRWSGTGDGIVVLSDGDTTMTLTRTPGSSFLAGEQVTVSIDPGLRGSQGQAIDPVGFAFQFYVGTQPARLDLIQAQTLTTRADPEFGVLAYGGVATDLDNDDYPDLSILNEDNDELVVFLNRSDGDVGLEPFLTPSNPTGGAPSPSESADFDGDGNADIAIANIFTSSVSVLLGNGDGTFEPQKVLALPAPPRGIAVLDANSDGWSDIVATQAVLAGDDDFALLINSGDGSFAAATLHGDGGAWAVAAADMDEDGRLDLVVGDRWGEAIEVHHNSGDGTFQLVETRAAAGVWMISLGDLNGDGHDDVATADGNSDRGSVLFGDGLGGLGAAVAYFPPSGSTPFPVASDLGDLDGDGDLDWVLSNHALALPGSVSVWDVYLNAGNGTFVFDRSLPAPGNASCALIVDLDRDGDVDLALVDETTDQLILIDNAGPRLFRSDFETGDVVDWSRVFP